MILLEGKREVRPEDRDLLVKLGQLLAENLPGCRFRSGNAPGADELFTSGVNKIDPSRVELVLPYNGHRKSSANISYSIALDEINLAAEPETLYHSKKILGESLVNEYGKGSKSRVAAKAAYLIRDTMKVTGSVTAGLKKSDFAIFYDDLKDPGKGGTGHTMKVCDQAGVPKINQKVWMGWLDAM